MAARAFQKEQRGIHRRESEEIAVAAAAASLPPTSVYKVATSPAQPIDVTSVERARRSSRATEGSTWVQPAKKKVGKPRRGSRAEVGGGGGGVGVDGGVRRGSKAETLEEVKEKLRLTQKMFDMKGIGASKAGV